MLSVYLTRDYFATLPHHLGGPVAPAHLGEYVATFWASRCGLVKAFSSSPLRAAAACMHEVNKRYRASLVAGNASNRPGVQSMLFGRREAQCGEMG